MSGLPLSSTPSKTVVDLRDTREQAPPAGDPEPASSVDISVVIPVLDEAAIIEQTLDELIAWFADARPDDRFEILVVDDGSLDATPAIVAAREKADARLRLIRHGRNFGRGRAVRSGFEAARGRCIVTMDADLSYAPHHIERLVTPILAGEADITLASAYHPDSKVENVPWRRMLTSRLGNRLLRLGTYGELHTVTCLVRGYSRDVVRMLELTNDGKDFHLEVIQKAPLLGFRLQEVPAHLKWRDRRRKARAAGHRRGFHLLPAKRSTIISHLSYSFLLRPGLLLALPMTFLAITVLVTGSALLWQMSTRFFAHLDQGVLTSFYVSIRGTLIDGGLTLLILSFATIMLLLFTLFAAMSAQNKKTYEEMVVLLSRLNARLDGKTPS
ncbi:MAG: glycosyltransferase family 2 protein [Alphaproteobacteria bacterium]